MDADGQCAAILAHMRKKPITPLDALNQYGCFRLSARIHDLRSRGHNIETKIQQRYGKRFAEYHLNEQEKP